MWAARRGAVVPVPLLSDNMLPGKFGENVYKVVDNTSHVLDICSTTSFSHFDISHGSRVSKHALFCTFKFRQSYFVDVVKKVGKVKDSRKTIGDYETRKRNSIGPN